MRSSTGLQPSDTRICGGNDLVGRTHCYAHKAPRPRHFQVAAVFTRQDSGLTTHPQDSSSVPAPSLPNAHREPRTRPLLAPGEINTYCEAIVLAGGPCDNPLAVHRAMPAVRFGAMYRLIDVPIGNCVASGIDKIYVLTQFNSHELNTHITQSYPPRGFSGSNSQSFVDVLACVQTPDSKHWHRGSAEAVARNLDSLLDPFRGGDRVEDLVILSGQAAYRMDFAALVNAHRASGADITLATYCVDPADAARMGVVQVDPITHQVTNFTEKPSPAVLEQFNGTCMHATLERPFLASLGIYVFRKEALETLLASDASGMPPAHFGHDVLPAAISQGLDVRSHYHRGFWKDVSRLRDFYNANLLLARPNAPLRMGQVDGTVAHRAPMPPPRLHNCSLHNVLLGDAVVLEGCRVRDSVLGCGSYVGQGSRVEGAVLLGCQVYQGRDVTLRNAVLDLDCSVGDGAHLVNMEGVVESNRLEGVGVVVRDGLVLVGKGAVVPPGTRL